MDDDSMHDIPDGGPQSMLIKQLYIIKHQKLFIGMCLDPSPKSQ
jgi:hypothetical protein